MDWDSDLCLYEKPQPLQKFKVVGLLPHPNFQKCRYLVEMLHSHYPKVYAKPEIRAMLNLDWDEFLTKMKRRHGKEYYLLKTPVAVYHDGQLISDQGIEQFIKETYRIEIDMDFEQMAEKELIKYFTHIFETYKRKFVYLTIAVDERVVGSMLFMLYNDLVPITCDNFLFRCTNKTRGYKNTKVHRIAKYSWIQCGGFDLEHIPMPCENYSVPHDRRGVISMCNRKIHEDNSTQFYITLEPASWMDYNYVAFGQLVQGAEILNLIEKIGTYYEKPVRKIEIVNCGEFTLCPVPEDEYSKALNPPFETLFSREVPVDEVDSILSLTGYKEGKYSLQTDLKSYLPFTRYSRMFDTYMRDIEVAPEIDDVMIKKVEEEEEEPDEELEKKSDDTVDALFFTRSRTFYRKF